MPSRRLFAGLAAALLAVALLVPAASARTVKLRAGGFSVRAPAGFRLKAKKGIYRVTGRGLRLVYARVPSGGRTPAAPAPSSSAPPARSRRASTRRRSAGARGPGARRSRCGRRARG